MNTTLIINFATAGLTFIFGLLLLLGIIYPGKLDSTKLMFGIILIVYGIYRFVTSLSRIKQEKLEERKRRIDEEREKLLRSNENL